MSYTFIYRRIRDVSQAMLLLSPTLVGTTTPSVFELDYGTAIAGN